MFAGKASTAPSGSSESKLYAPMDNPKRSSDVPMKYVGFGCFVPAELYKHLTLLLIVCVCVCYLFVCRSFGRGVRYWI